MIERHISLEVHPGRTTEFERFFADRYRPPVLLMPGLIECVLLREAGSEARYQIVFRWATAEDAVAWRVSETHQALQPAFNELHGGTTITAYEAVA